MFYFHFAPKCRHVNDLFAVRRGRPYKPLPFTLNVFIPSYWVSLSGSRRVLKKNYHRLHLKRGGYPPAVLWVSLVFRVHRLPLRRGPIVSAFIIQSSNAPHVRILMYILLGSRNQFCARLTHVGLSKSLIFQIPTGTLPMSHFILSTWTLFVSGKTEFFLFSQKSFAKIR